MDLDIDYDCDVSTSSSENAPKANGQGEQAADPIATVSESDQQQQQSSSRILPLRIGLKANPPGIVLLYQKYTGDDEKKRRQRYMPLRNFENSSDVRKATSALRRRHKEFLENVPVIIIKKFIRIIQEIRKGATLEVAVQQIEEECGPNPTGVDLNKNEKSIVPEKLIVNDGQKMEISKPENPELKVKEKDEEDLESGTNPKKERLTILEPDAQAPISGDRKSKCKSEPKNDRKIRSEPKLKVKIDYNTEDSKLKLNINLKLEHVSKQKLEFDLKIEPPNYNLRIESEPKLIPEIKVNLESGSETQRKSKRVFEPEPASVGSDIEVPGLPQFRNSKTSTSRLSPANTDASESELESESEFSRELKSFSGTNAGTKDNSINEGVVPEESDHKFEPELEQAKQESDSDPEIEEEFSEESVPELSEMDVPVKNKPEQQDLVIERKKSESPTFPELSKENDFKSQETDPESESGQDDDLVDVPDPENQIELKAALEPKSESGPRSDEEESVADLSSFGSEKLPETVSNTNNSKPIKTLRRRSAASDDDDSYVGPSNFPESETNPEHESLTILVPDAQPATSGERKSESESKSDPELEPEPKLRPAIDLNFETEPEIEPVFEPEANVETEIDPEIHIQPKIESERVLKPEIKFEFNMEPGSEPQNEPESEVVHEQASVASDIEVPGLPGFRNSNTSTSKLSPASESPASESELKSESEFSGELKSFSGTNAETEDISITEGVTPGQSDQKLEPEAGQDEHESEFESGFEEESETEEPEPKSESSRKDEEELESSKQNDDEKHDEPEMDNEEQGNPKHVEPVLDRKARIAQQLNGYESESDPDTEEEFSEESVPEFSEMDVPVKNKSEQQDLVIERKKSESPNFPEVSKENDFKSQDTDPETESGQDDVLVDVPDPENKIELKCALEPESESGPRSNEEESVADQSSFGSEKLPQTVSNTNNSKPIKKTFRRRSVSSHDDDSYVGTSNFPESETNPEPESLTTLVPDAQPPTSGDRKSESGSESKSDPELEPEPKLKPKIDLNFETEPESELVFEPEANVETKTDPETHVQPKIESELVLKPEIKLESNIKAERVLKPEIKVEFNMEPGSEPENEPESEVEPEQASVASDVEVPGLPDFGNSKIATSRLSPANTDASESELESESEFSGELKSFSGTNGGTKDNSINEGVIPEESDQKLEPESEQEEYESDFESDFEESGAEEPEPESEGSKNDGDKSESSEQNDDDKHDEPEMDNEEQRNPKPAEPVLDRKARIAQQLNGYESETDPETDEEFSEESVPELSEMDFPVKNKPEQQDLVIERKKSESPTSPELSKENDFKSQDTDPENESGLDDDLVDVPAPAPETKIELKDALEPESEPRSDEEESDADLSSSGSEKLPETVSNTNNSKPIKTLRRRSAASDDDDSDVGPSNFRGKFFKERGAIVTENGKPLSEIDKSDQKVQTVFKSRTLPFLNSETNLEHERSTILVPDAQPLTSGSGDRKSESESKSDPELECESKIKPTIDLNFETEPESEPVFEPGANVETKSDPESHIQPKIKSEGVLKPEIKFEFEPGSEPESEAESEIESKQASIASDIEVPGLPRNSKIARSRLSPANTDASESELESESEFSGELKSFSGTNAGTKDNSINDGVVPEESDQKLESESEQDEYESDFESDFEESGAEEPEPESEGSKKDGDKSESSKQNDDEEHDEPEMDSEEQRNPKLAEPVLDRKARIAQQLNGYESESDPETEEEFSEESVPELSEMDFPVKNKPEQPSPQKTEH